MTIKRKVKSPIAPEKIEALKASSAVRVTRSRLAHAPDAKGRKGDEMLISGPIWSRIEAEARARKIPAKALFDQALEAGVFTLEEDRFEEAKNKEG